MELVSSIILLVIIIVIINKSWVFLFSSILFFSFFVKQLVCIMQNATLVYTRVSVSISWACWDCFLTSWTSYSILIRPHPAIWRLVHGMAVVYLVALTFLLFQVWFVYFLSYRVSFSNFFFSSFLKTVLSICLLLISREPILKFLSLFTFWSSSLFMNLLCYNI